MTTSEFSNAFDTLLNSFSTQAQYSETQSYNDVVLDEYEKSLFLTQAQEEIVIELYSGRTTRGSFEETEESRKNLRNLIKTATIDESITNTSSLYKYSQTFVLPKDLLFITYESVKFDDPNAECFNDKSVEVIPVRQDELHRIVKNPFRKANKRRVLRVDSGTETVELISDYNIDTYTIRYLSKPTPIVLSDFSEVTIDGYDKIKECELDSTLHIPILERAVMKALSSRNIRQNK